MNKKLKALILLSNSRIVWAQIHSGNCTEGHVSQGNDGIVEPILFQVIFNEKQ